MTYNPCAGPDETDIEAYWNEARAAILAKEERDLKRNGDWDESDRAGFEAEFAPSDEAINRQVIRMLTGVMT